MQGNINILALWYGRIYYHYDRYSYNYQRSPLQYEGQKEFTSVGVYSENQLSSWQQFFRNFPQAI